MLTHFPKSRYDLNSYGGGLLSLPLAELSRLVGVARSFSVSVEPSLATRLDTLSEPEIDDIADAAKLSWNGSERLTLNEFDDDGSFDGIQ